MMATMLDPRATLNSILRQDFLGFLRKVFEQVAPGEKFELTLAVDALAYVIAQVMNGDRRRQIVALPPRSLKSIAVSVALPAFILGHKPTAKIICVSYSADLAAKHSADCRGVMKSDWYRNLFPGTSISPLKDTESYFKTTAGGFRDATSIGGTLTGKGGNLIIVDDPLKPQDAHSETQRERVNDWYTRTLITRLDNKSKDAIIIVMQRIHTDDLIGHVTKLETWHQLILPAIAEEPQLVRRANGNHCVRFSGDVLDPVREPVEVLRQLRDTMLPADFSAQYQQNPVPLEGDLVKWTWFGWFDKEPEGCTYTQSWDFAAKDTEFSAYTVCTTWAIYKDQYYLVDVFRKKLSSAEMFRAVCELALRWNVKEILIEDAAAGSYLLPRLRLEAPIGVPRPITVQPDGDKATRLHAEALVIEQGRVYLKKGAPWLKELQLELAQFPRGKYSDQVDSISQFLKRAESRRLSWDRAECINMYSREPMRKKR